MVQLKRGVKLKVGKKCKGPIERGKGRLLEKGRRGTSIEKVGLSWGQEGSVKIPSIEGKWKGGEWERGDLIVQLKK